MTHQIIPSNIILLHNLHPRIFARMSLK